MGPESTESTEHPKVPEVSSHVRVNLMGGYIIRPTSQPDEWSVTFCARADPGGWLPGWVKAIIAPKQAAVLSKFKAWYSKEFGKGSVVFQ